MEFSVRYNTVEISFNLYTKNESDQFKYAHYRENKAHTLVHELTRDQV